MNDPVSPSPEAPSRPLSVWRNWITFAGVVVAAGSLFAFLLLLTLDLTGRGAKNPYLGILTYLVAPGFLFLGLILVLGGAWHENRRRVKRPNAPPPRVAIDLSRPRDRQILTWFVVGATAFMMLTRGRELPNLPVQRIGAVLRRGLPYGDGARVHDLPARVPRAGRLRRMPHRLGRRLVRQGQDQRHLPGLRGPLQQVRTPDPDAGEEPAAGPGDLPAVPLAGEILRAASSAPNTIS